MLIVVDLTELALSREWSTAAQAREFVTACLGRHGLEELSDAATLVASELVTNVLVHTSSVPTVRVVVLIVRSPLRGVGR